MSEKYGYLGNKSTRTYYQFDNPDCPVYNEFQDFLKQVKLGYGKVTDQLTREIRHGRINKNKAIRVQEKFQSRSPKGAQEFAKWLGISVDNLDTLLLKHSNSFSDSVLSEDWRGQASTFIGRVPQNRRNRNLLIDQDFTNIGKGV